MIVRRRKKIHGEWWSLVVNEETEKEEWITQKELAERKAEENDPKNGVV